MEYRKIPRVLLAAPGSGSGKTLLVCALLAALKEKKIRTAAFKCGPDYIDPMFHRSVIGIDSTNLDSFFAEKELLRALLCENAQDAAFSVVEGVMGYFDGLGGMSSAASTCEVAAFTETPVILIVNCRGMSLSAAAQIKGFLAFEREVSDASQIRGVILNQVSPMMYPMMKEKIEELLPVKCLGYLPKVTDCLLESRHLGLVLPEEIADLKEKLAKLAKIAAESLDLDGILALGEEAPQLPAALPLKQQEEIKRWTLPELKKGVRIGFAYDEAFNFYYKDNLALLRKLGAEIVPFSPLHDEALPKDLSGMILVGGYPELYAGPLSDNKPMIAQIRAFLEEKKGPVLAECGGFLYLHEQLEDEKGNFYPMVGAVKGKAFRTPKLSRFGYITLSPKEENRLLPGGETIPAHEFHYWDTEENGAAFTAKKPTGKRSWSCMVCEGASALGFPHLYYYGNISLAGRFLSAAAGRNPAGDEGANT